VNLLIMAGWTVLRVVDDSLVAGANLGAVLPSPGMCAEYLLSSLAVLLGLPVVSLTWLNSEAQLHCTPGSIAEAKLCIRTLRIGNSPQQLLPTLLASAVLSHCYQFSHPLLIALNLL